MKIVVITHADIQACPIHSMHPEHYHNDGSCLCVEPECQAD